MAYRKETSKKQSSFNKITISLASPETILEQSSGEVLKPDEKGNDTTMPFPNFIHYTPSLFGKAFYRPLRKITVELYGKRKQTKNKHMFFSAIFRPW